MLQVLKPFFCLAKPGADHMTLLLLRATTLSPATILLPMQDMH